MAYILIFLGIVALISGIVILSRPNYRNQITNCKKNNGNIVASFQTERPMVTDHDTVITESQTDNISGYVKKYSNINKPKSNKDKGNEFEDFVVNILADYRLKLLNRTQDVVSSAGVIAESCNNPDLHLHQKRGNGGIDYYVECKYRSNWKDDAISLNDYQMERYRKFQRENRRKVLIALGVGGTPSSPETFRLIPIDSITGNIIKRVHTQFAVEPTSSALVEYMNQYFTAVFEKARSNKSKYDRSSNK